MTQTSTPCARLFRENIHPRIFVGPEDLAGLRARTEHGIGARALAEILRRCEEYTHPGQEGHIDPGVGRLGLLGTGQWGSPLNPVVHALGFAALVTEEERWLTPCVRMMRALAEGAPACTAFDWPFNFRYDAPEPVSIASLSGHLPIVYDLLYPQLTPAAREMIGNYLRRNIVAPYFRTFLNDRHKYAMGIGMNPPWHELYTWAWSLAAVYDHGREEDREAMALLATLIRRAIHLGLDRSGTIGEGPGYGSLDAYRWVSCAEILFRAGVCNFWEEEPQFTEMLRHWTYLIRPDGGFLNRSDATGFYESPLWPMLIHARHTDDPVAQWTYEQYGGRACVESGRAQRVDAGCPGFYLLWDRDEAKSISPDKAGWPTDREGGLFGEHIIRTDWGKEDLVCSVVAGGRQHGCFIHQHADAGHLSLYALGEAFSIEAGYGDKRATHHTLLHPVETQAETVQDGFEQAWHGGATVHVASTKDCAYVCVDPARMWQSLWNYRHVLVVRALGAEPYVLILDNVNQCNDWSHYDWTLNTHPDNTITTDQDALRATIQGRTHRLECAFATFGQDDYPKAHTLALATDHLNSHSFGTLADGSERILAVGERPRLLAHLAGYNGVMLAALMPRRAENAPVEVSHNSGPFLFSLVLNHGEVTDTVLCSPIDRHLDHQGISGEATLAIVRRNREGKVVWWGGCEICSLRMDGQTLLAPSAGLRPLATSGHAGHIPCA